MHSATLVRAASRMRDAGGLELRGTGGIVELEIASPPASALATSPP